MRAHPCVVELGLDSDVLPFLFILSAEDLELFCSKRTVIPLAFTKHLSIDLRLTYLRPQHLEGDLPC